MTPTPTASAERLREAIAMRENLWSTARVDIADLRAVLDEREQLLRVAQSAHAYLDALNDPGVSEKFVADRKVALDAALRSAEAGEAGT